MERSCPPASTAAGKAQHPAGRRAMTRAPHRSYFFFAAFILPDPQEDLPLLAGFFDTQAAIVPPPFPKGARPPYRRAPRFLPEALTALAAGFLAVFVAARAAGAAASNSPRISSRNLS